MKLLSPQSRRKVVVNCYRPTPNYGLWFLRFYFCLFEPSTHSSWKQRWNKKDLFVDFCTRCEAVISAFAQRCCIRNGSMWTPFPAKQLPVGGRSNWRLCGLVWRSRVRADIHAVKYTRVCGRFTQQALRLWEEKKCLFNKSETIFDLPKSNVIASLLHENLQGKAGVVWWQCLDILGSKFEAFTECQKCCVRSLKLTHLWHLSCSRRT